MAKVRLTERRTRDLKADPNRTAFLWDAGLPGFGVRVSKGGVKAYVLWTRTGEKKRLLTLGRTDALSLDGARKAAAAELDEITRGGADLLSRRAERRDSMTVADGAKWFLDVYVPRRQGLGKMADRTAGEYRSQLASYVVPTIGHVKIQEVTRQDIEAMLDRIGWSKAAMYSRVRSLIRTLFNIFMAEGWRVEGANPAARIATPTERERTRTLSPGEQTSFFVALAREEDDPAARVIRLLFATGCRFNEARTLRWDFVDGETMTARLPQTKSGPKSITLTAEAMAVLDSSPRIHGNPFVFAGTGSAPLGERTIRGRFHRAAKVAGLVDIRPHDLRRTYITEAVDAGLALTTVAALVGHATIHMTARYAKAANAQVREAAEVLAAARRSRRGADVAVPRFGGERQA